MTGISYESDYDTESDEEAVFPPFARGGIRRPPTASPPQNYSPPRPTASNVTQTQLQTALARVSADIKKNADAIANITTQVSAVTTRHDKEIAGLRKEIRARTNDLSMSSILPLLLMQPQSKQVATVKLDGSGKPMLDSGGNVVIETENVELASNNSLLPLVLILALSSGGLGGSNGSSSDQQNILGGPTGLLLILALTGGLSGNKS